MSRRVRTILPALALALAPAAAHAQFTVFGLAGTGSAQQLVSFSTAAPGAVTTLGATGASLVGIDFRPATGQLFGYDGNSLFTLNLSTGAATRLYPTGATSGGTGVDFNPTVDRLRITDASGTNLRVNPDDGAAITDGRLAYVPGDEAAGEAPQVTAVAYTNNDDDPATGTTLFGIDSRRGTLVSFASPNDGTLTTVGSLGLDAATAIDGFDIVTVRGSNVAFLAAVQPGRTGSSIYRVDLTTGTASFLGAVGIPMELHGIAVASAVSTVPEPATFGLVAGGLALCGLVLRRRARLPG